MIVASPNSSDTLLTRDPENPSVKIRTSKLYLQISMRELHNDLLSDPPLGLPEARDADGQPVISDTALRALLPPQVRSMTKRHKQMCGCEVCIIVRQQQMSLNAYRLSLLRRLEKEASEFPDEASKQIATVRAEEYRSTILPNGTHLHSKPKDALISIMCPNVQGFDVPHMNCILRECKYCPKYQYLREEAALSNNAPPIKFHVYQKYAKCTFHGLLPDGTKSCVTCDELPEKKTRGKFSLRKHLTCLHMQLRQFLDEYYLPMLEKYTYHRPHYVLLGKYETRKDRKNALRPGDADTTRDYAEALQFEFTNEIMSEHFGNSRALSMEGSAIRTFILAAIASYRQGLPENYSSEDVQMKFHSHFSDDKTQNAASTHAHMDVLFSYLRKEKVLDELTGTVFDHTDGCAKQYRCATAIYLLSMLATKYHVTINRAIGAPGHGKDVVDALNAVDKEFLKKMMCRISVPDEDQTNVGQDKKFLPNSVNENKEVVSLAEEAARLCALERTEGAKGGNKHKKRESEVKMKERIYHVRKREDMVHTNLKCKITDLPTKGRKHAGLLSQYNIHVDPELGVGRGAIRRIPCACEACERYRKRIWVAGIEPEKQPRFEQNKECKYWPIFGGHNDWRIITSIPSNENDPLDVEEAKKEVLEGVAARMAEQIECNNYGAVMTEDEATHGYYLVEWTSEPYALQEETDEFREGELVCDATYLDPVGRARNWYTPGTSTGVTLIRIQHVVAGDVKLLSPSPTVKLPRTCNRQEAIRKKAVRLSDSSHEEILDEINRRDVLNFEEQDIGEDTADDDASSDGGSDGEGSSEEEEQDDDSA
jgi:hypothetical protein